MASQDLVEIIVSGMVVLGATVLTGCVIRRAPSSPPYRSRASRGHDPWTCPLRLIVRDPSHGMIRLNMGTGRYERWDAARGWWEAADAREEVTDAVTADDLARADEVDAVWRDSLPDVRALMYGTRYVNPAPDGGTRTDETRTDESPR